MIAFSVINHSPGQTLTHLRTEYSVPLSKFQSFSHKPNPNKILLVSSVFSFINSLEILNSPTYSGTKCLVFCTNLTFGKFKGMYGLDSHKMPTHKVPLNTEFRPIWDKAVDRKISFKNRDYVEELSDSVKRGSILNPLMSYIYTLPSSTHQKPIKYIMTSAIVFSVSTEFLLHQLKSFCNNNLRLSAKSIAYLIDMYESPEAVRYSEAFAEYHKGTPLDKICETLSVDSYEMKYMLSVTSNNNEYTQQFTQKTRG